MKPNLNIDFDGVIHSYKSGWKGITVIHDEPVDGAFEALRRYCHDFTVNIYSTRSNSEDGINAMKEWFLKHGWPKNENEEPVYLQFPKNKPPALLTIDDRGFCFEGKFPSNQWIKDFRPWNKKFPLRNKLGEDFYQKIKHFVESKGEGFIDIKVIYDKNNEYNFKKDEMLILAEKIINAVEAQEKGDEETYKKLSKEIF